MPKISYCTFILSHYTHNPFHQHNNSYRRDKHFRKYRLRHGRQQKHHSQINIITASSAGIIRKSYNPCEFFAEENIAFSNESSVTLVHPRNQVYILTGSTDPFIGLSASLINRLQHHFSHRMLSRFLICVFIGTCYVLSGKRLFS